MPELPEVQTIVNDLNRKIVGRKINAVWIGVPKLIKQPNKIRFCKLITGKKIIKVERRGKNILIRLSGKYVLLIHLKMTGHLLLGKWKLIKDSKEEKPISTVVGPPQERNNQYIRIIFYLNKNEMLGFSDLRKFGKIILVSENKLKTLRDISSLGQEALEIKFDEFQKNIGKSSKKIKTLLMDQKVIAGIGNIYSDESLWLAKINPLKIGKKLTKLEIKGLYSSIKKILKLAVKLRGASISDFRDTAGLKGHYGQKRCVYGREKESCVRCGAKIKRIKINGRSAHFCPYCQNK